jgi:hypothetical protein
LNLFHQLGYYPFTKKMLESKKLRHEEGQQSVETEQLLKMRELSREYDELKARVEAQGKNKHWTYVIEAYLLTNRLFRLYDVTPFEAVTLFVGTQSRTETPTRLSVISSVPTLYELIGQQVTTTN